MFRPRSVALLLRSCPSPTLPLVHPRNTRLSGPHGQVGATENGAASQGSSPEVALVSMSAVSPNGELFPGGVATLNDEYEVIVPSGRHALWACYQSPGGGGGLLEFTVSRTRRSRS